MTYAIEIQTVFPQELTYSLKMGINIVIFKLVSFIYQTKLNICTEKI